MDSLAMNVTGAQYITGGERIECHQCHATKSCGSSLGALQEDRMGDIRKREGCQLQGCGQGLLIFLPFLCDLVVTTKSIKACKDLYCTSLMLFTVDLLRFHVSFSNAGLTVSEDKL